MLVLVDSAVAAPLRWEAFPIEYVDAIADGNVDEAFDAWAGVEDTELVFVRRESHAQPSAHPDRHNFIWMDEDWPYDEDKIAVSDVWADEDGEIVAFDIHVNGQVSWATDGRPDAFDLQAALVHEIGHVLGLEHSEVPSAAMFPSIERGATWRRSLDQDDVEAVQELYGLPQTQAPPAPPPQGCATTSAPMGWVLPMVAAAALCRKSGYSTGGTSSAPTSGAPSERGSPSTSTSTTSR
jgi:hypothetical protein